MDINKENMKKLTTTTTFYLHKRSAEVYLWSVCIKFKHFQGNVEKENWVGISKSVWRDIQQVLGSGDDRLVMVWNRAAVIKGSVDWKVNNQQSFWYSNNGSNLISNKESYCWFKSLKYQDLLLIDISDGKWRVKSKVKIIMSCSSGLQMVFKFSRIYQDGRELFIFQLWDQWIRSRPGQTHQ